MPAKWNMVGKPITTGEMALTTPQVYQKFRLPTTVKHSQLQGVGLGLIFHDAIYDDVYVELWADNGGPSKLIATSNTVWTKAQIDASYPLDFKYLFMGFQFSDPVTLRAGTYYHLTVRASNYTGDASNHIAWKHDYPDLVYDTGFSIETIDAARVPLEARIFAAEL